MITLYFNAVIHTMDEHQALADAFVVRDGAFALVGSRAEAEAYVATLPQADKVTRIDLRTQAVLPGLNDSHMHFLHLALSMRSVDLSGTRSIEEIRERMRKGLAERKPGQRGWIEGEGWNQDFFTTERRFPTAADLDDLSDEVPILIKRSCFHIGVLNTVAMRLIGLTRDTAASYGDLIELTAEGEPNGVIKENLLDTLKAEISTLDFDTAKAIIEAAQKTVFAQGLTAVQSDDIGYMPNLDYDMLFRVLQELEDEGKLKLHIGEQCLIQKKEEIDAFFKKGYRYGPRGKRHSVNCIKLLSDGSLGARTAAMREPYYDQKDTTGIACFTQEELNDLVLTAHRNHCPVAIHAIGDRAMEMSLDAILNSRRTLGYSPLRDSIVHCQITDRDLLERFRDLEVLAMVQPIFIDYDLNIVEDRVGPELASTSYAWKSMIDLGVHVSFGTDCPVEKCDSMPNIYSAVARRGISPKDGVRKLYLPQEKVSMEEAIYAYTMESAYAAGMEKTHGSITAGKRADFIVLDRDLFALESEEEILQTKVLQTYIEGELVYQAV